MSEKDQFLYRPEKPYPIEPLKCQGSIITDKQGKNHIDFMMGWCVGNLGWNSPHVKKALRRYEGPEYLYPSFMYQPWDELAARLCSVCPGHLTRCFRTTGGSESVDAAIQIAMAFTGRKKLVSVEDSYHGNTMAALSIGASETRKKIPNLLPHCEKISLPLDAKALAKVETRLKKKDVAAFVMEPVLCNMGVHIPEQDFMRGLRDLCTRYGTCLIIDEVATGFGRTGKLFACGHFALEPDILCLGKAITNGSAGMGATLTTETVAKKVKGKVSIYSTYGWHPLAVQAAIANIDYFTQNSQKIFSQLEASSQYFRTRLSQMPFRTGGKLNIIGMAISVNLAKPAYAAKVTQRCRENGLLISNQESRIVMFPALNVNRKTAKQGLDILQDCC